MRRAWLIAIASVSLIASTAEAGTIDTLFAQYVDRLPEPTTLSQQNGFTAECPHHGGATYTLLQAASQTIPVATDADLPQVVKWARHADPCIRQIAIDVLVTQLGYDRNQLSLPNMHEPEHHQFHAIHAALKARLDTQQIAYDAALFGELVFLDDPVQAVGWLTGRWIEEVDARSGAQTLLEVTGTTSRMTWRHLPVDPAFPDTDNTADLQGLSVVDGHFVAAADPSQHYWPVTQDVMWFRALSPYWRKLHRVSAE